MHPQEVNGIINQAKVAKAKSAHAQVFEQMQIEEIMCAKSSTSLIEYLQSKQIIGNEIGEETGQYQINIPNLLEQEIEYGKGQATESTKKDVYILEEQEETNSNGEIVYQVKYYGNKATEEVPLGTVSGTIMDFDDLESTPTSTKLVVMFRQAQTDECTNVDGTCTREDHLHIGDYVNYINPTSGEYTVSAGELGGENAQTYLVSQNQLNWRVLGIEGSGDSAYIKLIAGSPMKKSKIDKSGVNISDPYLYMRGAKPYLNAISELNKICALYNTNIASKVESVKIEDIDNLTGVTTDESKQYYNVERFLGAINYGGTYSYENHYTPTSWLNSTRTTVSGTVNGYLYSINRAAASGVPYVTMSNTRICNMLFDNVERPTGKAYWLASVGVRAYTNNARFGPGFVLIDDGIIYAASSYGLFTSDDYDYDINLAVRPVVYLKPGVTNAQCSKVGDKTEETWNVQK